ncbi:MAG: NTP transferase domain-containing protein [Enterocloster sp.]
MQTGAVIVAAGMSTRMKQFKQLMKIGDFTMAERVIMNFKQARVEEIAVVTGFQAEILEDRLRTAGVTFLRNERYASTQMLDSAKIGLSHFLGCCDRILFCPVDVPMFSSETVKKLLKCRGKLVIPVHHEVTGHPILMEQSLLPEILKYNGERGLKGALDSLDTDPVYVAVEDAGAVMDADTGEEFERLLHLYRSHQS